MGEQGDGFSCGTCQPIYLWVDCFKEWVSVMAPQGCGSGVLGFKGVVPEGIKVISCLLMYKH